MLFDMKSEFYPVWDKAAVECIFFRENERLLIVLDWAIVAYSLLVTCTWIREKTNSLTVDLCL